MADDPVVEETRTARAQIVDEYGQDVHAFFEYIRRRERRDPKRVVSLEPNAPEPLLHDSTSR